MHTLHLYTRGTRGLRISHKDHITRERDKPHGYRYGPQPRGRTTPSSSWESATVMEMAVESMEMAPGAIPHPDRVPEQRPLSPKYPLRWWWCHGTFCGDLIRVGFMSRGDVY